MCTGFVPLPLTAPGEKNIKGEKSKPCISILKTDRQRKKEKYSSGWEWWVNTQGRSNSPGHQGMQGYMQICSEKSPEPSTCGGLASPRHTHSTERGRGVGGWTAWGGLHHLMRKMALQQKSDLEKWEAAETRGFQIPTWGHRRTLKLLNGKRRIQSLPEIPATGGRRQLSPKQVHRHLGNLTRTSSLSSKGKSLGLAHSNWSLQ